MKHAIPEKHYSIAEVLEKLERAITGNEKFSEWAQDWIEEPTDESVRQSRLTMAKQSRATESLWAAFHSGELSAVVRSPETGELLRIPKEEWWGDSSWEVWLRSGVVSVASTQSLSSYNGYSLFIDRRAGDKFIRRQREASGAESVGGRPQAMPWDDVFDSFEVKCSNDGIPDSNNPRPDWCKPAHAQKWIHAWAEKRGYSAVSPVTVKRRARDFLKRVAQN